MKSLLTVWTLLSFSLPTWALGSVTVDGGYLYSRSGYSSPTSAFTMLSKAGTMGRGTFTAGISWLDFVASGQVASYDFAVPASVTVDLPQQQATTLEGGIRLKTPFVWTGFYYCQRDSFFLIENTTTDFNLRKATTDFGVVDIKLFGWGSGYRITIDGEAGIPIGTTTTTAGIMKYSYFARGIARVEFGNKSRVGVFIGVENQEYNVDTARYYVSNFFAGLTLAIGAGRGSGKSGSGGSSGGSRSGPGTYSMSLPNYPLY